MTSWIFFFSSNSLKICDATLSSSFVLNGLAPKLSSKIPMLDKNLFTMPGRAGCRTRSQLPASAEYERGANRVGASRLQQISHILQVPVAFFFEGAPNAAAPHGSNGSALSMAQIDDFVSDSDGLRLIGAFMRIDNAALRRRIVMLIQEIAGDGDN